MENIYHIAREIFSEEPQDPNSIQIEITNQTNPAVIYEILCILMAECLELKIPNLIRHNRNVGNFIIRLKQYFQSFGFDFTYDHFIEADFEQTFYNVLPFQFNTPYQNVQMRSEFVYYDFHILYEPDLHMSNSLSEFKLCIKIGGDIYRLMFKHNI